MLEHDAQYPLQAGIDVACRYGCSGESAARPLVRELKADAGAGDGFTSLISDLDRYGVRDSRSRAVDLTFPVEGADAEDAGGFGLNGTEDEESGENDRKLIRPPGE